eukprot:355589-Chlamydomonas_euryale.AAC.6
MPTSSRAFGVVRSSKYNTPSRAASATTSRVTSSTASSVVVTRWMTSKRPKQSDRSRGCDRRSAAVSSSLSATPPACASRLRPRGLGADGATSSPSPRLQLLNMGGIPAGLNPVAFHPASAAFASQVDQTGSSCSYATARPQASCREYGPTSVRDRRRDSRVVRKAPALQQAAAPATPAATETCCRARAASMPEHAAPPSPQSQQQDRAATRVAGRTAASLAGCCRSGAHAARPLAARGTRPRLRHCMASPAGLLPRARRRR